jgi:hypothetical protein
MLSQHESYAGAQVLSGHSPLVDLVTMQVDERTSGARRRELIDALVAADALQGDGGQEKRHKRLRDRLSNARKWKRERDVALGRHEVRLEGDAGWEDPGYIEFTIWSVIDDLRGFHETRGIGGRLRRLGALGAHDGLRDRSLNKIFKVVAEQLVFLEAIKVSRVDRARIKAAIRDLDTAAREELRHAQKDYLDELDALELDEASKLKSDASDSKIDRRSESAYLRGRPSAERKAAGCYGTTAHVGYQLSYPSEGGEDVEGERSADS